MNKAESELLMYNKLILEKVSFDKRLFWKEYRKGIKKLTAHESLMFRSWIIDKYGLRGKTAARNKKINKKINIGIDQ
ncbi:MAG: hypothetical protein HC819_21840 [Cyclobacteriaceae bacterium]|nr:hypothetical protein [Cyclobacteriaceae bacterium]